MREPVDNVTVFQIIYYIKSFDDTVDIKKAEVGSEIELDEGVTGIITEVLAVTAPDHNGLRQVVANYKIKPEQDKNAD